MKQILTIQVLDHTGQLIWERSIGGGVACRNYSKSGQQTLIVSALQSALEESISQLTTFDVVDRVTDIGRTSTEV